MQHDNKHRHEQEGRHEAEEEHDQASARALLATRKVAAQGQAVDTLIVTAGGEGIAPTSPLGLGGARVRLVGRDEPVRVSGSSTERDICARGDPPATLTDREVTLFILGTVEAGDDRLVEVGVFPRGGGLRARGKAALVGRKIGVGGESAGRNGWRPPAGLPPRVQVWGWERACGCDG